MSKKKRKKSQRDIKDTGTHELRQHFMVDVNRGKARVLNQTPLDMYVTKGYISNEQFVAGFTLYKDFYRSGFSPKLTLDLLQASIPSASIPGCIFNKDFYEYYRRALTEFCLQDQRLLIAVCCLQEYVSAYTGSKTGDALALSMGHFRELLNKLFRHYTHSKRRLQVDEEQS